METESSCLSTVTEEKKSGHVPSIFAMTHQAMLVFTNTADKCSHTEFCFLHFVYMQQRRTMLPVLVLMLFEETVICLSETSLCKMNIVFPS